MFNPIDLYSNQIKQYSIKAKPILLYSIRNLNGHLVMEWNVNKVKKKSQGTLTWYLYDNYNFANVSKQTEYNSIKYNSKQKEIHSNVHVLTTNWVCTHGTHTKRCSQQLF